MKPIYPELEYPTYEQLEYGFRLLTLDHNYLLSAHSGTPDGYWDSTGRGLLSISVNCNDYFAPAADCEEIPWTQVKDLFEKTSELKNSTEAHDFWMQWIADKRGAPNKHWRD